jgi:hypothetical protein
MSARTDTTTPNIMITLNGSTSSFTNKVVYGTGSSALSTSYARFVGYASMSTDTASTFGNSEIYIPNYAGSANKSFSSDAVHENNATAANAGLSAGLWSNTAAITSVGLSPDSGNFVANSTFSLYGIAAVGTTPVIAPKAIGGNRIDNDGTYWYHTFTSSGTFAPLQGITADMLVVAGGGASRNYQGGGGGAGGLLDFSSQSLTSTNYAITVGAGGALNSNGSDSQFQGLTLVKGGGCAGGVQAGPINFPNGSNGGSGGGGGGGVNPTQNGGTAETGQGSNGGAGNNSSPNFGAGGGGGKSAAGSAGTSSAGGNGGNGTSSYSSWGLTTSTGQNISGTVWYAGGGAGGGFTGSYNSTGGNGGGGNGGNSATDGTVNTGGGAGCGIGSSGTLGKIGGSGVVIIRYPIA